MAMVFCKQLFDFVRKTTIERLKTFQKPEHGKKYVFVAKCIKNAVLRENTVNKSEENEPEKLNNPFIIDYTKVKK